MSKEVVEIPIEKIFPSPFQPMKNFDFKKIELLAKSIKNLGIIQPVVVRRKGNVFELVAWERRLEALKLIKSKTAPAIIKNLSDIEAFKITLTENIQREELTPIEIANAIKKMKSEFNLTDKKIGEMLGISRSQITNYLRILKLPVEVRKAIENGDISFGHAKSLLSIPESEIMNVFRKIVQKNLSVRDTERIARKEKEIFQIEEILTKSLGTKVNIIGNRNKGKIQISYFSEDELINIIRRLKN
jgi:ParB family chromosome partitioning protein